VRRWHPPRVRGDRELWVAPVELQDGDEEIVGCRLLELLSPGASAYGS
jgi:hypothetical protein